MSNCYSLDSADLREKKAHTAKIDKLFWQVSKLVLTN